MCMNTLSIVFVIKIMVNSEIFLTHKSEYRFSQQHKIQKSNLNAEEQSSINVIKVFSSISLVTY